MFPVHADYDDTNSVVVTGLNRSVAEIENKALQIADVFNGVADYGGGNAANTLKVTVWYAVVDV